MARTKTLPTITDFNHIPDEALIPPHEQPYPLPEHWKWVRLGCVVRVSKEKTDVFTSDQYYVGLENLESGGGLSNVSRADGVKSTKSVFNAGHVLYGRLRPYLDKHVVADFSGVCSTDILVFETCSVLDPRFFDAWLSTSTFRNAAINHSKGINLPRISESMLAQFPVPLPPLEVQHRIVSYLDKNLARIDEVTEKLEEFLEDTKTKTENLLQAAVQGHLTKGWREQHHELEGEWKSTTLGEAFAWSSGGTPSRKKPEYYTGDIPWVKSGELQDGVIEETEEHITKEAIDESSAKLFPKGSVVIAMYGDGTVGNVGILGVDAATNQAVAVARSTKHTFARYLFFYLRANRKRIIASGKGGAQRNISQQVIKALPYEQPPLAEQEEILRLIDLNLDAFSQASVLVQKALDALAANRKVLVSAVLAGELSLGSAME